MSKSATVPAKPSIKFCPKLRQHEAGIDYLQLDGIRVKIGQNGYVAPTIGDEMKIQRIMEADKFCGITTWENREMPAEQRAAESEVNRYRVENAAMKDEMEAMREELAQLKKSQKA